MPGKSLMLHPQLQLLTSEPSIIILSLRRIKVPIVKCKKSINIHESSLETVMSVLVMPWLPLMQSCCRRGKGFPCFPSCHLLPHSTSFLTCLLSEGFGVGNICILPSSHASSKEKNFKAGSASRILFHGVGIKLKMNRYHPLTNGSNWLCRCCSLSQFKKLPDLKPPLVK